MHDFHTTPLPRDIVAVDAHVVPAAAVAFLEGPAADAAGNVFFFADPCYGDRSTMQMTHESVYRIDPDGKVARVITQPAIERPNGIAISPDEQSLYVVDSCPTEGGHRRIWG